MVDVDELERALARSKAEPEDLEDQGFWTEARVITIFPDMIAEIRKLRTTVATLGDSARAGANVLDAKDAEIRELRAENARLKEANGILEDGLQEVGDDYPGSSCQEWCQHQIKQARAALGEPQ